jgi:hypothetical protein
VDNLDEMLLRHSEGADNIKLDPVVVQMDVIIGGNYCS